jgi:hypothetical protein
MAVLLGPFDCFSLPLEGGEDVVGVILNYIVIDRISLGPTPWARLDVDIWHSALSRGVVGTSSQQERDRACSEKQRLSGNAARDRSGTN